MARPPGKVVKVLENAPAHADATKRAAQDGRTNGELPAKEAAGLRLLMSARIAWPRDCIADHHRWQAAMAR